MAANRKKSEIRDYLMKTMDDHCIPIKELEQRLETNLNDGLSKDQAEAILKRDGPNVLHPRRFAFSRLSIRGMFAPFTVTMGIASVLCFVIYGIHKYTQDNNELDFAYYGFILLVVSLINGCTYSFQLKTEAKTLNSFQFMWPKFAVVIRNNSKMIIPITKVVKGDIVVLKPGRRVPADIRLFVAHNLALDESLITKKKESQAKSTTCTSPIPLRSENMVFFGTHCVEGYAKGVVVATGNQTLIGKIARLMCYLADDTKPLLAKDIAKFEINIFLAILVGTTMFTFFYFNQYTLVDYFIFWVAMIVGNIPEGLMPTIGFVLVVLAKRLAKIKLVVKNLMTIDTLGLTSALCIGKTGTLTRNEKTVSHVWIDNEIYPVKESPHGLDDFMFSKSWFLFSRGVILSNTVTYSVRDKEAEDKKSVEESSDYAMLDFTEKKVGLLKSFTDCYQRVFENHFNPSNGYSIAVYRVKRSDGNVEYTMFLKGAPELLFQKCSTILLNGVTQEVDVYEVHKFYKDLEILTEKAETPIG
ncbi:hypothetical protein JTE90_004096 [Oedothorax gibbosus]|uniref:Cation-transporting P-type ATPase N-terminal domain-containing protein n=1 Tax=Oedothorax gibbosus TaxID=931172 RepID=A0AAV6UFL9_9ARAC|nr:hypothetical protein JTE90_004096 [Oedothorax gibbosus]